MADQAQPAAAPAAVEEKKNCPVCKKPIKRAKRYYRNGQYYCNFNCWRAGKKSAAEAKAEEGQAEKQ